MLNTRHFAFCFAMLSILLTPVIVFAKEGGDQYQNGIEHWLAGALPPPGNYLINYTGLWSGNLYDNNGDRVLMPTANGDLQHPRLRALYNAFRFVHVTGKTIGSASYAWQVIVPVVDLSNNIPALGGHAGRTGLGDITISPAILAWHHSEYLHTVLAMDFNLPTGAYDRIDPRKQIGANYLSIEPIYAITWTKPDSWELSAKFMYNYKAERNDNTGYRSGDEFHVDFLVGHNFGNWGVGLSGFYLKQLEDDELGGVNIGNRGQVLGLGPTVKYTFSPGLHMMASWQHETSIRNRFGDDKFLLKFIIGL